MKKYQATWGWQPPQYDRPNGNFRLFFNTEKVEREVTHKDIETGEETTETIHEWLCDVVEYEGSEADEIIRLISADENSVACKRWLLKTKIKAYDKSRHVEDMTINGVHLWLDSGMRAKVRENLETARQKGEENVTLRYNGLTFPMTVAMGWQLYYALLGYARDTWNVTEIHKAEASKLTTVEEILAYDYKQGYPEKLAF